MCFLLGNAQWEMKTNLSLNFNLTQNDALSNIIFPKQLVFSRIFFFFTFNGIIFKLKIGFRGNVQEGQT